MLTPNSSPARPQPAAFAAAEGSRAPPPQSSRSPSRSTVASSPSSFSARPRKPSSATSRFEPEPTAPIVRPSPAAQASSSTSCSASAGRANQSAAPPVRTVVRRASGKSRSTPARRSGHRPPPSASSASPTRKTSPAPIVAATTPGPSRAPSAACACSSAGAQIVARPPIRSAAARRHVETADPGQLADRLLARRVDVEDDRFVGQRQCRAELLGERLGARVEVRLEGDDEPRRPHLPQSLERRPQLGRVVGVVVIYARPVALPLQLEPPVDSGEIGERGGEGVEVEARKARPRQERRAR